MTGAEEHITDSRTCRDCGYELQFNVSEICPECGRTFDPTDPQTYYTKSTRPIIPQHILARLKVCLVIAGSGLALFLLVGILMANWRSHQNAMLAGTQGCLKQIGTAIDRYAAENNDQYPPLENWQEILVESGYLEEFALTSPRAPKDGNAFALNAALEGMKYADVQEPDRLVVAFEVEPGSVQVGGIDDVAPEHYKIHGTMILFADGHVESVHTDELASLRWDPAGDD